MPTTYYAALDCEWRVIHGNEEIESSERARHERGGRGALSKTMWALLAVGHKKLSGVCSPRASAICIRSGCTCLATMDIPSRRGACGRCSMASSLR